MKRRDFLLAAAIAATGIAANSAAAGQAPVYTGLVAGVAAGGYDVVAYQTQAAAVAGDETITADYEGATYRFSNLANRAMFQADPARYAPQYGGYCAYAVASGATASADPEQWNVVDGKLYLNYSGSVRDQWRQDIAGYISRADANWPDVLN